MDASNNAPARSEPLKLVLEPTDAYPRKLKLALHQSTRTPYLAAEVVVGEIPVAFAYAATQRSPSGELPRARLVLYPSGKYWTLWLDAAAFDVSAEDAKRIEALFVPHGLEIEATTAERPRA